MRSKVDAQNREQVGTLIVGSGLGGLCAAIKLLEAGSRDFLLLEKADDVGGTWRDNTYPGCACDVQSHLYSFSFAGNPEWSRRYAGWEEIQTYILRVTAKYGLRAFVRFQQEVTSAVFDETRARWRVTTRTNTVYEARHVILASGPLHRPAQPKLPGLATFKGKLFHSARWDHSYDLRGKHVVSIGTGGSAIQYVPKIAEQVGQLHVFQRSAAWVIPRDERAYTRLEKRVFRAVPALRKLHRARLYWSNEARIGPLHSPGLARVLEAAARLFIRFQVNDAELARKLTPDYTIGCKRILISNEYYPTFNRSNVSLETEGLGEITENSVLTRDGRELRADCIILGTGFEADPRAYLADIDIRGLGGRRLADTWQSSAEAHYGVGVAGYPNFFQLLGPNSVLGHNSVIFMIEAQVRYILECMKLAERRGADYVSVTEEAQTAFNARVQHALSGAVWSSGCRSWYQQADGKNVALWPFSTARFWRETRKIDPTHYAFGNARATASS